MQHPDYLIPITEDKMKQDPKTLSHYIGGNEMSIPDNALFSEDEALEILSEFAEKKQLLDKYKWIDLYNIEFDHGF